MDDSGYLVGQREIAKVLGISQPTVSLALKNDPRVSEKTRERVQRKAREMGYSEKASNPSSSRPPQEAGRRTVDKRSKGKLPVSQAEIAQALGLSQSTVSEALKGRHIVSQDTRNAVRLKAAELGYVPDPNLVALSNRRSSKRKSKYLGTIAWVTAFDSPTAWKKVETFQKQREGIAAHAEEFGYKVEDFWLAEPGLSNAEAREILLARGIRGLILAPQPRTEVNLTFDFSDFAVITFGATLEKPAFHRVGNNVLSSTRLAYRKLQELGYRRVGLVIAKDTDARVDNCFSSGYASTQQSTLGEDLIPPHIYEELKKAELFEWLDKWKPDAILSMGYAISVMKRWFDEIGIAIGRALAVANLDRYNSTPWLAGIDQQTKIQGGTAVIALHALLKNSQFGVPDYHSRTLTQGVWRDGESVPKRN